MNKKNFLYALLCGAVMISSCQSATQEQSTSDSTQTDSASVKGISAANFDTEIDGKKVKLYELTNNKGAKAIFTNYGGRLVSLLIPSKNGNLVDVVIGMSSPKAYQEATEPYFGATIGRYGNRIAKGKFTLDGKPYTLALNNGQNTLHGGKKGFQYVVWDAEMPNNHTLVLHYISKDMEEGYPGTLDTKVTYTLTDDNDLKMDYEASTDKKTVVNLTNHAFFNLNGEGSGDVLKHQLKIFGNEYLPVDTTLIPTGKPASVKGNPFDFTAFKEIGKDIENKDAQLAAGKGYDHNYILNKKAAQGMYHAATVIGDQSGIQMDVYTQEPGLQFYSGNFMQSKNTMKTGAKDDFRTAFCLETQHFPDSPNQKAYPSTELNPGQQYKTSSIYHFSIAK